MVSLTPTVRERTKYDEDDGRLTLFRMDFAATIRNEAGEEEAKRQLLQTARYLKYDVKLPTPQIAEITKLAEAEIDRL